MRSLDAVLQESVRHHIHLCPRQVLGARIGLAGMKSLGFDEPPSKKRMLVIVETDGCFVDGLIAATGCTVGHRTMRGEDYGKVAAAFVDTKTDRVVRVAPALDIRQKAFTFAPEEPRHYFAQMRAYQIMPDDELLVVQDVVLNTSIEQIVSRPGLRVTCDTCGEEIMNERETHLDGLTLCRPCAYGGYYRPARVRVAVQHADVPFHS